MRWLLAINDLGGVCFVGFDENARKGVFYTRINTIDAVVPVADPFCVLSVGDKVPDLRGAISDFRLSDSLNARGKPGDLVLWVKTDAEEEAILSIRPSVKPLIVIPGMAASKLVRDREQLWISANSDDINALQIYPNVRNDNIRPTDIIRVYPETFSGVPFLEKFQEDVHGQMIKLLSQFGPYNEVLPITSCDSLLSCDYALPENLESAGGNLYVFPYDWRVSNDITAFRLKSYIAKIRSHYPEARFDVLAHSMGGLVARRYLMLAAGSGEDSYIDRCITVGTPFLGAPVSFERILVGRFFGKAILDRPPVNKAMTNVLWGFPGFFELFPSPSYFQLEHDSRLFQPDGTGPILFKEKNWDVDVNRITSEGYTEDRIRTVFDARYETQPIERNRQFHFGIQDDWSSSGFGVEYLHIVGRLKGMSTPAQVSAREINLEDDRPRGVVDKLMGFGDTTVPFISAARSEHLLAPKTTIIVARSDGSKENIPEMYQDELTQHVPLTRNLRVHRAISYFLRTGKRLWNDSGNLQPLAAKSEAEEARRELRVIGDVQVGVETPTGEKSLEEGGEFIAHPKEMEVDSSVGSLVFRYRAAGVYKFLLRATSKDEVFMIERKVKAEDYGATLSAERYLDIKLRAGDDAMLTDAGNGSTRLVIHHASDRDTNEELKPQYQVSGAEAQDEEPPSIHFYRVCVDGSPKVQLTADDTGVGVAEMRWFSIGNGPSQPYTGLIDVQRIDGPRIKAFATDKAGNRTGRFDSEVIPSLHLESLSKEHLRLSWERSCWPLIVEATGSLSGPASWQKVEGAMTQDDKTQNIVFSTGGTQRYFRLRLAETKLAGEPAEIRP